MRHTRRQFIVTAAALATLSARSTGAAPPVAPVRRSLVDFSSDPARVASLRNGVAAMKALRGSDHRSWFFWAATHAYSDALFKAEAERDPKLKSVDADRYWNKCPHFGQSSADFAIWHRAYLHFFERNLRAAAGDALLALPYWDYSSEEGRTFPAIYAPAFLDRAKTIPNPLYHPNREASFARGLLEVSAVIGQAAKTSAASTFFHVVGKPGFGGDVSDSEHTQIGLLEQRPHNDIHLAVGGVIGDANGAMAEITTAAFDPVFWVHHANVDRLWARWANMPGKEWGPLPPSDWFDERPWLFVDADGSDVRVSRREAIKLVSSYDIDYPSQLETPPSSKPTPAASAPGSGGSDLAARPVIVGAAPLPKARRARVRERELLADRSPFVVSPARPARREFGASTPAADQASGGVAPPQTLVAPELADETSAVLLELSGITFRLVPSSGFAVFLDSAGETPSVEPVGLIDIFGATHHGMASMPGMGAAQRFDVTAILRRSRGPYTLRVEPYTLLVTHEGRPTRSRSDSVKIASVRFVVMD
ncbi:MAG TPA: tyrosinase family protein [Rhizomicrobium sp.]|nr:tyrosinase family protein [Rhizomicrobium sp.]